MVAGCLLLLLILLLAFCWYLKSRKRKQQQFERRESIRRSIREGSLRKKEEKTPSREDLTNVAFVDVNTMGSTQKVHIPNGSTSSSMEKLHTTLSSFDKHGAGKSSSDSVMKRTRTDSFGSTDDFTDEEELADATNDALVQSYSRGSSSDRIDLDLDKQRARMGPPRDHPVYANGEIIRQSYKDMVAAMQPNYDIPTPEYTEPSKAKSRTSSDEELQNYKPRTRRSYQNALNDDMLSDEDLSRPESRGTPSRRIPIHDTIPEDQPIPQPRSTRPDMEFRSIDSLPYETPPVDTSGPTSSSGGRSSPTSISAVIEGMRKPQPDPYDPYHRYPVGYKPHPVRSFDNLNKKPMPRAPRRLPPPRIKPQTSYRNMLDQMDPSRDMGDKGSLASGMSDIPMKAAPYGFRRGGPYDGTSSVVDYIDRSEHGSLASHPYTSMDKMDKISMSTDTGTETSSIVPSEAASSMAPSEAIEQPRNEDVVQYVNLPIRREPSRSQSIAPSEAIEQLPSFDTASNVLLSSPYHGDLPPVYANVAYDNESSQDSTSDRSNGHVKPLPRETSM